jgi:hypothetical protein
MSIKVPTPNVWLILKLKTVVESEIFYLYEKLEIQQQKYITRGNNTAHAAQIEKQTSHKNLSTSS